MKPRTATLDPAMEPVRQLARRLGIPNKEIAFALGISTPAVSYCFYTPEWGSFDKQKARVREYIRAVAPLRIAEAEKLLSQI